MYLFLEDTYIQKLILLHLSYYDGDNLYHIYIWYILNIHDYEEAFLRVIL